MPTSIKNKRRCRWPWGAVVGFVLLANLWIAGAGEAAADLEYKVKAGYLVNFARYVEWPKAAAAAPDAPFIIGVLDDGEAVPIMQKVLNGKAVDGHPIQVHSVEAGSLDKSIHILMVTRAAGKTPEEVSELVGSSAILVVGESEKFAERGGIIGFQVEDGNIRINLNLERAVKAGLKVSSKLSSVARLVKGKVN